MGDQKGQVWSGGMKGLVEGGEEPAVRGSQTDEIEICGLAVTDQASGVDIGV